MSANKITLTLAALGALAAVAVVSPSYAEPTDGSYYYDGDITVIAPYRVHRDRRAGALGEEVISVSRVVSARDLDLRYAASVDEFHRRVVDTARVACDEADAAARGDTVTSDRSCVRSAVNRAMPQFRAVVQRAQYTRY